MVKDEGLGFPNPTMAMADLVSDVPRLLRGIWPYTRVRVHWHKIFRYHRRAAVA